MNTESPFFTLMVMVGGVFTAAGMLTYVMPPKKINFLYGYRTTNSMKSKEKWDFAQLYSAKRMVFTGLILLATSGIGLFYSYSEKIDFGIGMGIVLCSVVYLFFKTENALKKQFPDG